MPAVRANCREARGKSPSMQESHPTLDSERADVARESGRY